MSFYTSNRIVVLIAQAIGVLAAVIFYGFASNLAVEISDPMVRTTGGIVALAAILTSLPIVMLAVGASASATLVRMVDLTDVALFLAIAAFLGVVAGRSRLPVAIRSLCGLVASLCVARAVLGIMAPSTVFDTVAPVGFLSAVIVLVVWAFRRPTPPEA